MIGEHRRTRPSPHRGRSRTAIHPAREPFIGITRPLVGLSSSPPRPRCYGVGASSERVVPRESEVLCRCVRVGCRRLAVVVPRHWSVVLVVAAGRLSAQGLGGAGTVQGTVKDPTGGVMQAVDGRDQQSGHRLHADHDHRRDGPVRLQQPAAESLSRRGRGAGLSAARARRRRAERRADHARPDAGAGRRDERRSRSSATRRTCSSAIRPRTPTSTRA